MTIKAIFKLLYETDLIFNISYGVNLQKRGFKPSGRWVQTIRRFTPTSFLGEPMGSLPHYKGLSWVIFWAGGTRQPGLTISYEGGRRGY
jgi:hypothetical protein